MDAMPFRGVRLAQRCEMTADRPGAIHTRRKRRIWIYGVQCQLAPDGNLYVNPEEFNKCVEREPLVAMRAVVAPRSGKVSDRLTEEP